MQLATVLRIHAAFFLLLAAHFSAEAAEMHQRSHAAVTGSVVRLADVVTCNGCADSISTPLLKLELMLAPGAERSLRISRQELQQLLLLNDVDLNDWHFKGAEQTIIVRQKPGSVIAATATSDAMPLPTAQDASPAVPAPIAAPVDTAPVVQAEIPSNVVRVVNTIRPISKGELVKESDVELIPAKDDREGARAYQNLDEVVGKEAKRLIPANWAVDSSYVQPKQLVKRNDIVTIRAKAAGVTVTVSGIAKDDGAAGEVVTVVPEGSKDPILARVTGMRELEVFASGPRY